MAVYTETIQLEDEVTPNAKAAERALDEMTRGLEAAQAQMYKAAALGDKGMFGAAAVDARKYQEAIHHLREVVPKKDELVPAASKDGGKGISSMFADASHAAEVGKESITAALGNIGNAFEALASGDAKGAVTGLFDALADVSKILDLVVPGLGQVVSAVLKIAGGIAGVTAGLIQSGVQFAIEASQGKQQMLSMFDALGAGVVTGEEVDGMLSDLSDRIGISKDVIGEYTKAFAKMGVTGKEELENLTLAAASANAIVGEGGAAAFEALQKKIQIAAETGGKFKLGQKQLALLGEAGVSVTDVAAEMGMETKDLAAQLQAGTVDASKFGDALTGALVKKGGPALERMSLSWESMRKRFDQAVGDMFEDLSESVDPLMKEVKGLLGIFDASSESGKAMKWAIEGTFSAILGVLKELVPIARHFLLDLIIYGLQAYIALKPTIAALKEWLKSAEGIQAQNTAWEILKSAVLGVAVVVGALVAAFGLLVAASATVGLAILSIVGYLADLMVQISGALSGFVDMWIQGGIMMVTGLVNGITSGAGMVMDAVTGLANGAVDTFKSVLGIASPSKVGVALGANFGESTGLGMEAAASTVTDASSSLAAGAIAGMSPPTASTETGTAARASRGAGASITIYIDGAGKSAEEITDDMIAAAWERLALTEGA